NASANGFGFFSTSPAIGPLPSAPLSVTAVSHDRSVAVSWQPPASTGGSTITSYTVSASPGGASEVTSGTGLAVTVGGLVNQQPYTFTVTATNALGSSLAGAGAAATPIGTPDPPVQVSASATYGEALVTWQPPANNGGSPITGYLITISPGGRTLSTPDTIFGWTGLPPSPVSFTIQAVNAFGAGPASTPSNVVVPLPSHLIIISLSQQHLWAYTNNVLWLDTMVTTGRPELPTPPGDHHIMNKQSPLDRPGRSGAGAGSHAASGAGCQGREPGRLPAPGVWRRPGPQESFRLHLLLGRRLACAGAELPADALHLAGRLDVAAAADAVL